MSHNQMTMTNPDDNDLTMKTVKTIMITMTNRDGKTKTLKGKWLGSAKETVDGLNLKI